MTDEFEKAMPALENGKNNDTSKIIAQSMDKGDEFEKAMPALAQTQT